MEREGVREAGTKKTWHQRCYSIGKRGLFTNSRPLERMVVTEKTEASPQNAKYVSRWVKLTGRKSLYPLVLNVMEKLEPSKKCAFAGFEKDRVTKHTDVANKK